MTHALRASRQSAVGDKAQHAHTLIRAERHETMSDSNNPFGEVIYSYSRQQAIRDGVLVDLTPYYSIQQAWKHHFACTSTVWGIIENCGHIEDLACQLISVAAIAKMREQRADTDALRFSVNLGGKTHSLKLHCGPGDTPEPVLTLMLPCED